MMMSWLRSHGKSTSDQALFYCQPKTLDFGAEAEVMVDAKQAGKKERARKRKNMSFFPEERECEAIKRGQTGAPGSSQAQHTVTALQYSLPPDG
jgi:hypothetical protein